MNKWILAGVVLGVLAGVAILVWLGVLNYDFFPF